MTRKTILASTLLASIFAFSTSLLPFLFGLSGPAFAAQMKHEGNMPMQHMNHADHMGNTDEMSDQGEGLPVETGQSAFAAIAEIVEELRSDPETDWSKVDIDALRQHLVEMDNVTLKSQTTTQQKDGAVVFTITGTGEVIGSIQRMVNGHSPMLAGEADWEVTATNTPDGAIMTIKPAKGEKELAEIAALGFYGVMTIGVHHQMHHKMIATGHNPH